VENVKTKQPGSIIADGAFVALGSDPESGLVKPLNVEMNERGEILVDADQRTNVPGLFAAGDVVQSMKQIVVAVGQGAIAADSAYRYIRSAGRRQGFA